MEARIRIGISSCLLGNAVRYDGGHKLDQFLSETMGRHVEYVPVCPEVECGMPVPRESMQLEDSLDSPRLITNITKIDKTGQMVGWTQKRVVALEKEDLAGFIFKSNSPSCGMKRIKIYNVKNVAARKGIGLFARAFIRHFPLLPVEEDGRLHDPVIRENFVERLFALFRWRAVLAEGAGLSALVAFHTRHQLQIMAHSNGHYQKMDRLIAEAEQIPLPDLYEQYGRNLMDGLRLKATPKKNAHVLKRAVGCFKARFSAVEKAEMLEAIDLYRNTRTPLIVPITLINHYVRKYDPPYLKDQYYLKPHPAELLLRYHA